MAVDGADSGSTKSRDDEVVISEVVSVEKVATDPLPHLKEDAMKAHVNAVWEQLNSNGFNKPHITIPKKPKAADKPKSRKPVPEWMVSLGLAPKRRLSINLNSNAMQSSSDASESNTREEAQSKESSEASEEARRIAAAALAAVREATAVSKEGKIEVNEVREFAGEEVKLRKFVDPNSKEAQKAQEKVASSSGLDKILEQITKKQKLNILDKSKQDWGEFKEEKGLEEELDAYKKSGDKYLDKVSFLQRAELREYEREREIRLALQAKRRFESQRD